MKDQMEWRRFLLPYELAVTGFLTKLYALKKEFQIKGERSPIEIVSGRIKTVDSILEKMDRLNVPLLDMQEAIYDIAGVRIICKYVEDVYTVLDILTSRKDLFTIQIKDYIKEPKPSGYRSLHLISKYRVETIDGSMLINMEFQIRTHAMHLWASTEHALKYKYYRNIPENIKKRLVEAANITTMLDNELGNIKNEIENTEFANQREEGGEGESDVLIDSFWKG